jgi:hypothetical protein
MPTALWLSHNAGDMKGHAKKITADCSGCSDPNSEGTHQGCTVQHGHVGCEYAKEVKRSRDTMMRKGGRVHTKRYGHTDQ